MSLRNVGRLFKDAGVKFWDDNGQRLGAALAFYAALSLSPLLLAVVAIAGLGFGQEAARGEVVEQLRDTVGQEAAATIEQLAARSADQSHGVAAAVVAFAVALFGASGVFSELQSTLNTIWRVPGRAAKGGFMGAVRGKLSSFLLVGGTALLLVASFVVGAVLSGIEGRVSEWVPQWVALAGTLNFLISFGLSAVLFALIFRVLPEIDLAWADVLLGAAVTAVLFAVGRHLIGLYLGRAAVGSPYGAAGTFVVLLVWIYYSTQILLYGAELTFVYAQRHGHGIPGPVQSGVAAAR